jgi:hypothetical protein
MGKERIKLCLKKLCIIRCNICSKRPHSTWVRILPRLTTEHLILRRAFGTCSLENWMKLVLSSVYFEYIHDGLHFFFLSGVGLSPLGTAATSGLLYKPQMIDEGDCGAISGIKTGRGNRSTRRKSAPAPLCSPQIPHDPDPGSNPGPPRWEASD